MFFDNNLFDSLILKANTYLNLSPPFPKFFFQMQPWVFSLMAYCFKTQIQTPLHQFHSNFPIPHENAPSLKYNALFQVRSRFFNFSIFLLFFNWESVTRTSYFYLTIFQGKNTKFFLYFLFKTFIFKFLFINFHSSFHFWYYDNFLNWIHFRKISISYMILYFEFFLNFLYYIEGNLKIISEFYI